ncbi:MAG TPA: YeeE/YedE thiosulfate transporter family protein [Planctomycetota bacterium]|nr:YeeE/YedE thiosulfate transporter family protein [Planctomycetota bacterium]HRR79383.1 YeeE/YedE thiosulfate transporter family protein [Planctomycetota bacterium]HRT93718.1 YeeE/YedE thiosulfate transporter family protein [Planctomycetota bacterium]
MLKKLHGHKGGQLLIGLAMGFAFGFLLQKAGVTTYDVIINQLLFRDFTVLKVMLTAMITGMVGFHLLKGLGLAQYKVKPGGFGSTLIGALIFGVGFGTLGYCPGTVVGAVGQGALDALFGGLIGALIGAALFAALFPKLKRGILGKGHFGELTVPELLKVNPWAVVVPVSLAVTGLLWWLEVSGF